MKIAILIILFIIPGLAYAETKCSVIDYPDRDVIDCSGDESAAKSTDQKAIPIQSQPPTITPYTSPTDADTQTPTETPQKSPTPDASITPPISQPAQPVSNQNTIIHRQGRQQYQQSLEDAKAARKQKILELQQSQTAPAAATPPAQ